MELRRANVEDAPAIARQLKQVADEGRWVATQSDATVEGLAGRFEAGMRAGHVMLVIEEGGEVVGALGLHPSHPAGVYALGMSILAEYRGRGWGRRLVEAALEIAREQRIRKVELEVFVENGAAIGLYASCGFEVEGVRRDHYERLDGSLRSALVMAWFADG